MASMYVNGYWNPERMTSSSPDARSAAERCGDGALHRACLEFESVFIREILSASGLEEMFGPFPGLEDGEGLGVLSGTSGTEVYAGEALDSLSDFLAFRGILGLGELLYRSLGGLLAEESKEIG